MKSLNDFLKELQRLPQVITPKDAALILAYTGIPTNAKIVDAGSGSGFLAIFLAWYCPRGKVVTYEIRKEFAEVTKRNVKKVGLNNVKVKNQDITKGISEKGLDLVTLDLKGCEEVIDETYRRLKKGGWIAVYSPHVEQMIKVLERMQKIGFVEINCIESIIREWQSEFGYTRPKTQGLMHTGWISFGRK